MYLAIGRIAFAVFAILGILSVISIFNKKFRNKKVYIGLVCALMISIIFVNVDMKSKEKIKKPTVTTTTISTNTNDKKEESKPEKKKVDKDKLKTDIDKIVTQDLKGKSYSLDLLTPSKNADQGYIISIQVDNAKFTQEDACKKYANEFLSALSKMESVYSVDMNFISNSKLTFGFRIEGWNSVKNNDNKLQNVEFQKF